MHGALEVRGEGTVAGFVLKMERIWAGIQAQQFDSLNS
jgi:hypothetical protein